MNIEFKILWVEDDNSWRTASSRTVRNMLDKYQLEAAFTNYDGTESDYYNVGSNDFDLILMDFRLAKGRHGDEIIKNIRDMNVLTDILFYSASFDEMMGVVQKSPNDFWGVYFSDRSNDFDDLIERLIKKIIRRSEDIVNLRGLVLDNSSDLEFRMKNIILKSFNVLDDEEKQRIRKKLIKNFKDSSIDYNNKCKAICEASCPVDAALQSKDYLFDAKKKSIMIERLAKIYNSKGFQSPQEYLNTADKYSKEVSTYRNALGHISKLDKQLNIGTEHNPIIVTIDSELYKLLRKNIIGFQTYFTSFEKFLATIEKKAIIEAEKTE